MTCFKKGVDVPPEYLFTYTHGYSGSLLLLAGRLSLATVSGGCSSSWHVGFPCGTRSCCGARALGLGSCGAEELPHAALQHVDSSQARDQASGPALAGRSLATGPPGKSHFVFLIILFLVFPFLLWHFLCPLGLIFPSSLSSLPGFSFPPLSLALPPRLPPAPHTVGPQASETVNVCGKF